LFCQREVSHVERMGMCAGQSPQRHRQENRGISKEWLATPHLFLHFVYTGTTGSKSLLAVRKGRVREVIFCYFKHRTQYDSSFFCSALSTYLKKAKKPKTLPDPLKLLKSLFRKKLKIVSRPSDKFLRRPSQHYRSASFDNGLETLKRKRKRIAQKSA
jgi:hypothetical protein